MDNKKFWMVSKNSLILIAGIVWCIAGFNVARLGIISYKNLEAFTIIHIISSIIIFLAFGTMFLKMSSKHVKRIRNDKNEYKPFWTFFDLKAYMIMIFMMSGGIGLRAAHVLPEKFIAYFYTGLGSALALAGISFLIRLSNNTVRDEEICQKYQ